MSTPSSSLLQLPLFPLQTVLFPGGALPLQIFEVRYLDMIARCHNAGDPFGVVCLTEGSEVRRPAPSASAPTGDAFAHESFVEVGTLARITELARPQAGLIVIRCIGAQRFRICRSEQRKFGLWVGDVERLPDDAAIPVPDDLAFTRDALRDLVRNIEHSIAQNAAAAVAMPLCQPYRWDDCGWLANRWCEMLPLGLELKQRLMALDSPVLRLELAADALGEMGFTLPRRREG